MSFFSSSFLNGLVVRNKLWTWNGLVVSIKVTKGFEFVLDTVDSVSLTCGCGSTLTIVTYDDSLAKLFKRKSSWLSWVGVGVLATENSVGVVAGGLKNKKEIY